MREVCDRLIGSSTAMQELKSDIPLASTSDVTVLISGESGVGKKLVARMVQQRSKRGDAALIAIRCAGVRDSTLESQLFGHTSRKSAGKHPNRRGWLALAESGTILLENVNEIGPRMQARLARFLENGEIQPVGMNGAHRTVDVRVIAATNTDLFEQTTRKRFREDLYYRLNVIHLKIPPLRERPEDIAELLNHFLSFYARARRSEPPCLTSPAVRVLEGHRWPGNVQELRNLARRLVLRCSGTVTAEHVQEAISHGDLSQAVAEEDVSPLGRQAFIPGAHRNRFLPSRRLVSRASGRLGGTRSR